ncbi:tripartite tricarboxylate transporter substrate binding protein [Ramlibacter henchirensis]|uniref:Tripartite tricarboxylate transporter substrate binding protein n=1 Tax=Ramlibacter henchirensis TaxID=204072 RepID=A0A4Z0BV13_9BURK|nr:tripartite tricarboxylate transporter substrate binding protein [Ramlibacter henchirensis]TFZ02552.1 tripartite tricarboxylate transporter substrate binding protein [Ramlibacter henchirensis]
MPIQSSGIYRRAFIAALATAALAPAARAQTDADFPSRPIKLVVPLAPGGVTDVFARVVAQQLGKELGGNVVVENRAGGGGVIGNTYVAQSKPDGYTLLFAVPSLAIDPALGRKLPYDALRDFTLIGLAASSPNYLVVSSKVPVNDVKSLVDLVHRNPGKYNYGHPGVGTTAHLSFELFKLAAKLEANPIPYKGSAPMIVDLAEGQVAMTSMAAILTMSEAKAGRIRVLATTATQRTPQFPDVPTMAEAGYPTAMVAPWFGIVGPAGIPPAVSSKLVNALSRALAAPEVKSQLAAVGGEVARATPAEFRSLIESDTAKWTSVVKQVGLTVEN